MNEATLPDIPAIPAIRRHGAFLLALIVAMAATLVYLEYRSEWAKAEVRAHTSAHVVATQFGWVFEASAQTLRRIEQTIELETTGRQDVAIADLNEAVQDLPAGYDYSVYDANGDLTYSSISGIRRINVADRAYFRDLAAGKEIAISSALESRQDGRPIFILARRIDRDGRMAGVATIAIPQSTLEALATSLGLPQSSTISLVRLDGMLIARAPAIAAMDLSKSQVFAELEKAPNGVYSAVSPADRVTRIVGYWRITGWPVVAMAGLDESSVVSGFWRALGISLILVLPLVVALTFVIMRLNRVLRIDEQRQAALKAAHDKNEYLLREIHHRVKNNLQVVMSLVRLQKMPDTAKDSLLGRVASISAVHEEMYRTDRFETVELGAYLRRLTDEIARAHGGDAEIRFEADRVQLSGDRAMPLGLLCNELVSNAFKHAWPEGKRGRLEISLRRGDDGMVTFCVADDGRGMPEEVTRNMGSRLIEAFSAQLEGTVTVSGQDGTRTTLVFPQEGASKAAA